MNVAIIPARGGSKRIPRKNIKHFCGKPIIAYSIEAAIQSGLFERVVVSTDCEGIAELALDCGAQVPFLRPCELADDHTVLMEVMKHAVEYLQADAQNLERVACVFATAPLMEVDSLIAGYKKLLDYGEGFVMSIAEFPYPVQRALTLKASGQIAMIQPQYALTRSQDLPSCYHDAAQFIFGEASAFLDYTSQKTYGIPVNRATVQDIDTEEDWAFAEMLYRARNEMTDEGK